MNKNLKLLLTAVGCGITIALVETLLSVNYDGVEFVARMAHRLTLLGAGAFAWNNI